MDYLNRLRMEGSSHPEWDRANDFPLAASHFYAGWQIWELGSDAINAMISGHLFQTAALDDGVEVMIFNPEFWLP
jgi:hypothetical protein